jgi:hypothetical protein
MVCRPAEAASAPHEAVIGSAPTISERERAGDVGDPLRKA